MATSASAYSFPLTAYSTTALFSSGSCVSGSYMPSQSAEGEWFTYEGIYYKAISLREKIINKVRSILQLFISLRIRFNFNSMRICLEKI